MDRSARAAQTGADGLFLKRTKKTHSWGRERWKLTMVGVVGGVS